MCGILVNFLKAELVETKLQACVALDQKSLTRKMLECRSKCFLLQYYILQNDGY